MKAFFTQIGFLVSYGLLYLLGLLPLRVLYAMARLFIEFPLRLAGYRRNVITTNLARSFPEKTYSQILDLQKAAYRHIGRLTAEVLRLLGASLKARQHCFSFPPSPFLQECLKQNRSVILVLGHYGNWEYAQLGGCPPATTFGSYPLEQVSITYKRQHSGVSDRLMYALRTRNKSGFKVIESQDFAKHMFAHRHNPQLYCLIADQCPLPGTRYSTTFLGQPTLMIDGPEILARRFGCAVAYAALEPDGDGKYRVKTVPICARPDDLPDGEITRRFAQLLEEDIRRQPEQWLWSHKRWKRRPQTTGPDNCTA